ncbi:MAG TPA: M24 family metallopeptidase [Ktedonobacterales bacterium]|nr:M24 family metallopeptidase [Ktedonobacterales bacterium]
MTRVDELQETLRAEHLDGWLFFDFRHSNAVAVRVLELSPQAFFSRRWMYYVPATGTPTKLVSSVESHVLNSLPGETLIYRSWQEYRQHLGQMLTGARRVAMEYVPGNAIPYVSLVDAGTVELIRGLGPEVVSSADFVQRFEAVLTPAQIESHRAAGRALMESFNRLLPWLREQMLSDTIVTELSVQREFANLMRDAGLVVPSDEKPLVAVNGNAANPHYSPTAERHSIVRKDDLLLLDFSAPLAGDDTVFADYTWMIYLGEQVPDRIKTLFSIISQARDTGIDLLRQRFEAGERIEGYEVDDAVRGVIAAAGYGNAFVHRTGHNIGTRVHGNGAHLDNLETHDTRPLLANTCTSIEPGIYLPDENLGLRTEVDVLLLLNGIEVTGEPRQNEVIPLLA